MNNKVYVGNLSFSTSETAVEDAFSAFGTVQSVNLIMDRETGRPRGFGFIEMANDAEANAAVDGLNDKELDGRPLKVSIAKPRTDRPGGGGGGGGRRERY